MKPHGHDDWSALVRLREAGRAVIEAVDLGRIVQVPDEEPSPELEALRGALAIHVLEQPVPGESNDG